MVLSDCAALLVAFFVPVKKNNDHKSNLPYFT